MSGKTRSAFNARTPEYGSRSLMLPGLIRHPHMEADRADLTADTNRLLEEVASEANLALALMNVVRNEGAPGIDGQTVEEAEADAPQFLVSPRCRRRTGPAMSVGERAVWS